MPLNIDQLGFDFGFGHPQKQTHPTSLASERKLFSQPHKHPLALELPRLERAERFTKTSSSRHKKKSCGRRDGDEGDDLKHDEQKDDETLLGISDRDEQSFAAGWSQTGLQPSLQDLSGLGDTGRAQLLLSILDIKKNPYESLALFNFVLAKIPRPWPVFSILKCHSHLIQRLPEAARAGRVPQAAELIESTLRHVKAAYGSPADFLQRSAKPALVFQNQTITHRALYDFVHRFRLTVKACSPQKPVVCLALPNGPVLAATCFAVVTYYTAAPINPMTGPEQFRADVLQARATIILTSQADAERLRLQDPWVREADIQIFIVVFDSNMGIVIQNEDGTFLAEDIPRPALNSADDVGIILFTSGTSGIKKVVPLAVHSLITGVAQVIDSWALTEADVCLNMMPLHHIGGLVRNIFAPIFAGGSTVCCPAFSPSLFWDIVEECDPTWYYASPSMHSVILDEGTRRPQAVSKNRIRLVCNAAGGLLPSLACQLRETFRCVVLPSYGMTECMPISTPPIDYRLDRSGTSGISTGTELSILSWEDVHLNSGIIGRICVRGEPLFRGYLQADGQLDRSAFNQDGWFDTGDLGYLDEDGYLYITGRSKEVINRGGEIISPFEVENAIIAASRSFESPISGRVSQVLAFAVQHDVLQEAVGIAIVTSPNMPRPGLREIEDAVRLSLQQAKWPVLVTYLDDLPKKNNKVLRIKLSERLGLPELTDKTPFSMRHWEAKVPLPETDLSVKIPSSVCQNWTSLVASQISSELPKGIVAYVRRDSVDDSLEAFLAPEKIGSPAVDPNLCGVVLEVISKSLHGYLIPRQIHAMDQPFPMADDGRVDEKVFESSVSKLLESTWQEYPDSPAMKLTQIFADILSCRVGAVKPEFNFFHLGGDSLRAGKLISVVRSEFNVRLPFELVFTDGSVENLSDYIIKNRSRSDVTSDTTTLLPPGCERVHSSTNPLLLLLQLFPAVIFYPMRRAFTWVLFFYALRFTGDWVTARSISGRLFNLVLSIQYAALMASLILPWIGIVAKWTLIGRYQEGCYPMWGLYHTRWWIAQKIVDICGLGIFETTNFTFIYYCRLMGASIGSNVKLKDVKLGEWDLIHIEDGAMLENCTCRPFAVERNTSMYLGRIVIGKNSTVGRSSIVAPGTSVPENACIGPNSSSWEIDDADEANRDYMTSAVPGPHWLFAILLTTPIALATAFVNRIPWLLGLLNLVLDGPLPAANPLLSILHWFAAEERIKWHYAARAFQAFFGPFFLFGTVLLIKSFLDLLFGKLRPSSVQGRGQVEKWRKDLMRAIFSNKRLREITDTFGKHYEFTSIAIRALGGRVGKRVYWPGNGPSIEDYHLLNIGNDVIFGSRSNLITSDAIGSEVITIGDSAMIADRVTLLPGATIGKGTVMGSGALGARGQSYKTNATYVGSRAGDSVCLISGDNFEIEPAYGIEDGEGTQKDVSLWISSNEKSAGKSMSASSTTTSLPSTLPWKRANDASASSPFGRAFYDKLAPYHVFGQYTIFCYSSLMIVFVSLYWNAAPISAIVVINKLTQYFPVILYDESWRQPFLLFGLLTILLSVMFTLQALLAIVIVISAKWVLLGRRMPGRYDWDKSSYCQRWQVYLTIEKLRGSCYRGHGILGMLSGTWYCAQYFRALGAQIGPNCALFASGCITLSFTEPDLLTLGERVAVDDASLVGHVNTRGCFSLNRLIVGDRCVLRTGSRLLSGAEMKDDSCLLEHTLIMGGDVVNSGAIMQGWPAEPFLQDKTKSA